MPSNNSQLWERCLTLIRQHVSEQVYRTWFAPIVFESYNDENHELLVRVSSPYIREYLEQNYVRLMGWAFRQAFQTSIVLRYRVVTDQTNGLVQEVSSERDADLAASSAETLESQPAAPAAAPKQQLDPQLDPHKTFANYIEGASNKLARTVGLSVAEHPGKTTFNPFFIYGPSGCGKTHLINAIGVQTKMVYPQKRVLYVSARLFQVQYTDAARQNTVNDFIAFYQSLDVLIVDDIHEWNTEKTLNTFFHIFDHLFRLGKQIILASDRPPVELEGIKNRLLTRFSCGVIAELEKPDEKLCIDILKSKCHRDGLRIPDDVILFIARTANGSVRDLEGTVNSLMAYSIVYNSPIDMRLAERVIKRTVKVDNNPLTIDDILDVLCTHFSVTQQEVLSKSRKRNIVVVRQLAMYLAQKYTNMPSSRIGYLLGRRDHSTVLHGCSTIEQRLKTDPTFADDVASIDSALHIKREDAA